MLVSGTTNNNITFASLQTPPLNAKKCGAVMDGCGR